MQVQFALDQHQSARAQHVLSDTNLPITVNSNRLIMEGDRDTLLSDPSMVRLSAIMFGVTESSQYSSVRTLSPLVYKPEPSMRSASWHETTLSHLLDRGSREDLTAYLEDHFEQINQTNYIHVMLVINQLHNAYFAHDPISKIIVNTLGISSSYENFTPFTEQVATYIQFLNGALLN